MTARLTARRVWVNVSDFGAAGNGTTDDSASIQAAIDSCGTTGGVVVFPPGIYHIHTGLTLPPGNTGQLALSGYGATLLPSSTAGPTISSAAGSADDVFCYFLIEGLEVDCSNYASVDEIEWIVALGGTSQSFHHITLRDIRLYDLHFDVSHQIIAVSIRGAEPEGGGGHYIEDILCDNVRVEGGNYGFLIAAYETVVGAYDINYWIDRVTLRDCYHSTLQRPPVDQGGDSFQIGGRAKVGTLLMDGCYGEAAGDLGFEINNATNALLRNCTVKNNWACAFGTINFGPTLGPGADCVRYENCTVLRDALTVSACVDFGMGGTVRVHRVEIVNCRSSRDYAEPFTDNPYPPLDFEGGIDELYVSGYSSSIKNSAASDVQYCYTRTAHFCPVGPTIVTLRDLHDYVRTAGTGTYKYGHRGLLLGGDTVQYDIDGVTSDIIVFGAGASSVECIHLGGIYPSPNLLTGGSVRHFTLVNLGDHSTRRPIIVSDSSGLTITGEFLFESCDFSAVTCNGYIYSPDGTDNVHNLRCKNNRYPTKPAPAAISVGASPFTYTNLTTLDGLVFVRGGTVSSIDMSTNDGGNFGGTGMTGGAFHLRNGDALLVTYSSAPTMIVIPQP